MCHFLEPREPLREDGDDSWLKRISFSEGAKMHLARALIMNPEVMVMQRPLIHFAKEEKVKIMALLQEHVSNRGIGLPKEKVGLRRPRTVFLSMDEAELASQNAN